MAEFIQFVIPTTYKLYCPIYVSDTLLSLIQRKSVSRKARKGRKGEITQLGTARGSGWVKIRSKQILDNQQR